MKKRFTSPMLVVAAAALLVALPMSVSAAPTIMHTATTIVGNQVWSAVGLTFNVVAPDGIRVLELGVYDSGLDGLTVGTTLTTVLFDAGQNVVSQMTFTNGDVGMHADGSYLFKPVTGLLMLAPGQYTIASYGFSATDPEHNSNVDGTGPIFNANGIQFVNSVWSIPPGTSVPPQFPTNISGPDFFDGPNMISEVPVPGAILLGAIGAGLTTWLRRRKTL